MTRMHLGRNGGKTPPVCNGASPRLVRAGLSSIEFARVPEAQRCQRCNAKFQGDMATQRHGDMTKKKEKP